MQREFLLNLLFLVFINLLIKPFFIFGIDRTIQNRVGLEDYGIYAALFNFAFLFSIVNDFGIPNFNNQRISQNRSLLSAYLPNILLLKIVLSSLYALLVVGIALLLGYGADYFHLMAFLILNQILLSFIQYFRSNIAGLGQYRLDSVLSVVERLLLILFCAFLLWFNPFTSDFQIGWFIYAQTLSLFLTALIAGMLVFRHFNKEHWQFDKRLLLDLLQQSLPYALIVFLMTVYTRIDFVMIERLHVRGQMEAGIYATAYRLLDAANVFGLLFSSLLLPMFSRLLKEQANINRLLEMSARLLFCGTILLSMLVYFFRLEIMELLYINTGQYAANILGILIFTFCFVGGGYIYGTLLLANNSLAALNKIFFISVCLNVILNYFIIPEYGALGAAWTTFFTQGFAFTGQLLVAKQLFQWRINWGLLRAIFGYALIFSGVVFSLYYYVPFGWKLNFLLSLFLGVLLGVAVGLLRVQWLGEMLQRKRQ